MSDYKHKDKQDGHVLSAYLLYGVSLFGILEIFTSGSIKGFYTPLKEIDITAYIILIGVAFLIHRGVQSAKILYTVLAIAWYAVLLFYLPGKFDHSLNLYAVSMQIIVSALALLILLTPD